MPRRDLTPAARLALSAGAYAANAAVSKADKTAAGRKAHVALIARMFDPDGRLAASDPAEFARRYDLENKAYMLRLRAKSMQRAEEVRVLAATARLFIMFACPECNRQAGFEVPETVTKQLCVTHWNEVLQAHREHFEAILDAASQSTQAAIAS